MKLLPKTQISAKKNQERETEIKEGAKLAKTIDVLRQTKSQEEANLRKFRDASLKTINETIGVKVKESQLLDKEIARKKEERLKLEAPVDLSKAWEEVNQLKDDLQNKEIVLISREAQVHNIEEREAKSKKAEKEATLYLEQSQKAYSDANKIRDDIEAKVLSTSKTIESKIKELAEQETDLISREFVIKRQVEQCTQDKTEMMNRDAQLISREAQLQSNKELLFEREEKVKEMAALSVKLNNEAIKNYDTAEKLKTSRINELERSKADIDAQYEILADKERVFGYQERDFVLKQLQVENTLQEIEKEKLHIASQQETLRQAWVNIKKLNH
jgi:hypothetical protein